MLLYPTIVKLYVKHIFTFNGMFEFRDVTKINDGGRWFVGNVEPVTQSPLQSSISAAVQLGPYSRRLPIRRTACSFSITKTENEYFRRGGSPFIRRGHSLGSTSWRPLSNMVTREN